MSDTNETTTTESTESTKTPNENTTNTDTDTGDTVSDVSTANPSTDKINELADKMAKKYKVKLDGEEVEVDEDELLRNYQLRKVSDKRLQEGVKARKQAEAIINLLKTDPKRVLSDPRIGLDVKKFAEDIIYQSLQEEMMTPEQRELNEYKRKVQEYEAQQKRIKQQQLMTQQQKLQEQRKNEYVNDISTALSDSGLPKTDYTVQRVVHHMSKAIKAGFPDVKASDVIDLVHKDYVQDVKSLFGSSSEETLFKILGDEVANKIRNYDINKFKEKNAIPKSNNVKLNKGNTTKTRKKKEKVLTPSQLRQKIQQQFGLD